MTSIATPAAVVHEDWTVILDDPATGKAVVLGSGWWSAADAAAYVEHNGKHLSPFRRLRAVRLIDALPEANTYLDGAAAIAHDLEAMTS